MIHWCLICERECATEEIELCGLSQCAAKLGEE